MHLLNSIEQNTNQKHLRQLINLRYLAMAGQMVTILVVFYGMGMPLPIMPMLGVIGFLGALNLASWGALRWHLSVHSLFLFLCMICDVGALAFQVHLSGGPANPFISLFLLQVILGTLLLPTSYAWILMILTLCSYTALLYIPVLHAALPPPPVLYTLGAWITYALTAILSVWFLTRIIRNLKERDYSYARLQQRQAEEDHIVRIGLLASGAAHELGTPLSTLSVILNDWNDPDLPLSEDQRRSDIAIMQAELQRCKKIVSDILISAGEVRGEGAEPMPLQMFMDEVVKKWCSVHPDTTLHYGFHPSTEIMIASDKILEQMLFSIFENAYDVSPGWIGVDVDISADTLQIKVTDHGPGFAPEVMGQFGKPYNSTKGQGHGMGLYLTSNILRQLSGHFAVRNLDKGAEVMISIPLSSIEVKR